MSRPYFKKAVTQRELNEGTIVDIDRDVLDPSSSDEDEFDNEVGNSFTDEVYRLATGDDSIENQLADIKLDNSDVMIPLTEDGLVKKSVVKEGFGPVLSARSIVFIHYRACLEGNTQPYDSTYLRGKAYRFLLNGCSLIPGVELAVKTMCKGEVAKVWIHYNYAYGEMGCPPRIPPKVNIEYTVEVVNFIDCKDAIEFEEMTYEDKKKASFEKIYAVCSAEHKAGTEMCENKRYPAAISRYQKARRLLEDVHVANEEEDDKRHNRLMKLYLNLAFCFLKLKNAQRTIMFCKKVLAIDKENIKGLYRLGLGYMLDNDFDRARSYLLKARNCEPLSKEINESLLELEEKQKRYNNWDKNFCMRMFQTPHKPQGLSLDSLESSEFRDTIKTRLEQFKESTGTEYPLSSAFNQNQIEVVKIVAESLDLYFSEKIYGNQKVIKVLKKNK